MEEQSRRVCLCSWEGVDSRIVPRERLIYGFLGTEHSSLEVCRVNIGEISSPDLGGGSGIDGFPYSGIVGFCSDF